MSAAAHGHYIATTRSGVSQCVAVCCSVLQCVAVCCSKTQMSPRTFENVYHCWQWQTYLLTIQRCECLERLCKRLCRMSAAPAMSCTSQVSVFQGHIGHRRGWPLNILARWIGSDGSCVVLTFGMGWLRLVGFLKL